VITEDCFEVAEAFTFEEQVLLRFGEAILAKGNAPGVCSCPRLASSPSPN
jgi:hypothetical protein